MAVADFQQTFVQWLPLENFDNAEWIRQQCFEMFLRKCESEVLEARKKGRRGKKRPATDLAERPCNKRDIMSLCCPIQIAWL
jgi:hypothetical protein